jgi:3-carboxy-cis,cis-muconate cycloisomerase
LPSDELFAPLFLPDPLREAVSGRAWVQGMLDAERALATAEARLRIIPSEAAEAIAACCDAARFDPEHVGRAGRKAGNPVEPLVRALREAVGGDAADVVHLGATSQDVLDTASMLVARRALEVVVPELDGAASACAALTEAHRGTVLAARTLLQQAVPTTFGLKAAGWLVGMIEARRRVVAVRDERLAAQLGGAAGTLAVFGKRGPEVLRLFAEELGLAEPVVPWHTARGRIVELAAALELVAGACAKAALDVTLLAQTEVGEVAVADGGPSSTMPQKRNPSAAVMAIACARGVRGHAGVLAGALLQEHERAAGAWHAEWEALSGALARAGAAAWWTRQALERLEVDADRMRQNLGEAALSERAASLLSSRLGRAAAHELLARGRPLREALVEHLEPTEVDEALDPAAYLGAADAFVDRALDLYRRETG